MTASAHGLRDGAGCLQLAKLRDPVQVLPALLTLPGKDSPTRPREAPVEAHDGEAGFPEAQTFRLLA